MTIENYQEQRARELNLPAGTGKRYSSEDLLSFIETSEEIEGQKYVDRFRRNVLIGFATPPVLALVLSCLPNEVPVVQGAKGISYMVTAAEAGWVGGGIIIEGTKFLYRTAKTHVPFKGTS
jgi:hypothetical protein